MTEVYEDIYKIHIPLPQSPLKMLNCFIIKGKERNLMIDNGFNTQISYDALLDAIQALDISMDNTDIFLTHLHADHTGLTSKLKNVHNKTYISDIDGSRLNMFLDASYWQNLLSLQTIMGFPKSDYLDICDHPAYTNRIDCAIDYTPIEEGQSLDVGRYVFDVIDIKGHTPGHLGLYEKKHNIMFCGDHVLDKISPNINLWDFKEDYLRLYLKNLKKIYDLDIKILLSSHRDQITDHRERITQLLNHHSKRLQKIMVALNDGKNTVYDVSSSINWDFGTGNFQDFPPQQKWFASSEIFAHLEHLHRNVAVSRINVNGIFRYKTV